GLGDVLRGRLLAFDALDLSFREFRIPTDPRNEVTWANREHIELGDYTGSCCATVDRGKTR
ncbi:MAG: molybdopterin biosynthesis protein MoeB, partial [Actinomycetia bacterium]|nr:molybdopterin biosynthesis protein MoeB [Actinomycetes bacterium]